MISPSRLYDISFVLLGVLAPVMKGHLNNPLIQSYGGNIAASFSGFYLLRLPLIPSKLQATSAAALALATTGLFEVTNGFGFMSNTYDPADYLANAIGVTLGDTMKPCSLRFAVAREPRGLQAPADEPRIPPKNSMEHARPAAANRLRASIEELAGRRISRPLGGSAFRTSRGLNLWSDQCLTK
jgi:hypothetical protein